MIAMLVVMGVTFKPSQINLAGNRLLAYDYSGSVGEYLGGILHYH